MPPTIPNGRLGKLVKCIEEETNKELVEKLLQDYSNSFTRKNLADWILTMIKKLEQRIGPKPAIAIFEKNGRDSCGKGFKNTVNSIMAKSNSIKDFVFRLQEHYKKSSFFEYIDENTIIGGHRKCYNPIKSASIPIDSNMYCYFCVGHGKEFYETAFKKPVEVEIIENVMQGGDTCKFKFKF